MTRVAPPLIGCRCGTSGLSGKRSGLIDTGACAPKLALTVAAAARDAPVINTGTDVEPAGMVTVPDASETLGSALTLKVRLAVRGLAMFTSTCVGNAGATAWPTRVKVVPLEGVRNGTGSPQAMSAAERASILRPL